MARWWTSSPQPSGSKALPFPTMWMPTGSAAVFNNSTRCTGAPATRALLAERRSAGSWWDNAGRTIVRSASGARARVTKNLIGDQRSGLHLQNIVNADHVRSAQNSCCYRCSRRALQKPFGRLLQLRQERFARRAQHQGKLERREGVEMRQDLGVLLFTLSEAEPRIDGDARAVDTRANRAMRGCIQIAANGSHHVFDGCELGPGFWRAAHVRDNQAGVMLRRHARQL